jgi:hypothetical protein
MKSLGLGLFFLLTGAVAALPQATPTTTFTYNSSTFLLNGQPFQFLGGQMDPQRVPRAYWADRLQKAKAMGLNTIFSYIYWDKFEPVQGQWNFSEDNDIAAFYQTVQEAGMQGVLRLGPYVCGERDWGGFPAWLSQVSGMTVRANNQPFLSAVTSYVQQLATHLNSTLVRHGGPVLMVQIENEYGNYASDHRYTAALKDILAANFDAVFYTTDAGNQGAVNGGQIPGALAEIDGDAKAGFSARNQYVTNANSLGPLLDGEFYTRWFDYWGTQSGHQTYQGDTAGTNSRASDIDWILGQGASFSLYMWHGGTNWGFGNGAVNFGSGLQPFTTSYDCGAPLDESGRPNNLYQVLRSTISKHVPTGTIPAVPSSPPLQAVTDFALTPVGGLFDKLPGPTPSSSPVPMEALGQQFGYVLYEYKATQSYTGTVQPGDGPRDRVIVYVNGVRKGVIDAIYKTPATVNVQLSSGDKLWLFVENLGRVDYGGSILDQRKGIVGSVTIGGTKLSGSWNHYSFPLSAPPDGISAKATPREESANRVNRTVSVANGPPVWYHGSFTTSNSGLAADTFLELPGGVKGIVYVNGFNLGRYWTIGPQQQLFLPGSLLKTGTPNDIVVLELSPGTASRIARGVVTRTWGNTADPDK